MVLHGGAVTRSYSELMSELQNSDRTDTKLSTASQRHFFGKVILPAGRMMGIWSLQTRLQNNSSI